MAERKKESEIPALGLGQGRRDDGSERIIPNTNRRLQVSRTRRKLFGKARQEVFLEHLAATCNITASAAAADICVGSVYRERMRNAGFREAWNAALEQGYARLEAALIERAERGTGRPVVQGDKAVSGADAPDEIDWDKAMDLLRQHRRPSTGSGQAGRGGHAVRKLGIEALRERVIRKLKAIGYSDQSDGVGSEAASGGSRANAILIGAEEKRGDEERGE